MALLSIYSNNPDLGWILNKNPHTISEKGPYKKPIRKGVAKGWFQSSKDLLGFHLYFQDHPSETSFGGEFEYLDRSRYSSPAVVISMMTECIRETLAGKTEQYDKEGFKCSVVAHLELNQFLFNMLTKNMSESVTLQHIHLNTYRVTCSRDKVIETLNLLYAICVTAEISKGTDNSQVELNRASMTKIMGVLKRANTPYRMIRSVLTKGVNNRDIFPEMTALLPENWSFRFGNNQMQRLDAIKACLPEDIGGKTLVDLGCGEMYNSIKLGDRFAGVLAVEKDQAIFEENAYRIKRSSNPDKFTLLNQELTPQSIADLGSTLSDNVVLMTEFLEHLPIDAVPGILKAVFQEGPAQVIITVPNKEFNQFYNMGENELRHPDHQWEPTESDMHGLFTIAKIDLNKYELNNPVLADCVDGIPCFLTFSFSLKSSEVTKETNAEQTEEAAQ